MFNTPLSKASRRRVVMILTLALALAAAACGAFDTASLGGPTGPGPGSNLGATPGGAQDFRQVRATIERGEVPRPDAYYVEGLLSEHDLPLGGACTELLCVRLASSVAPLDTPISDASAFDLDHYDRTQNARRTYVQVGFSTSLSADHFERPALTLALVVDVSGSMGTTKMEATKTALRALASKLRGDDVVSLIKFNDQATLLLPPTAGDDRDAINNAIASLHAGGSTNIAAGMVLGYQQIEQSGGSFAGARSKRLMLFTDANPNVGSTSSTAFSALVSRAASDGIGLSAFGVGIDFQHQLVDQIANLRGGNYFYLADETAIATIFDKDFDYLVTPLAYDLSLTLTLADGFHVAAVYGVKAWAQGEDKNTITVPTVFVSRNKGAIVVALERDSDAPLASGTLDCLHASLRYERGDDGRIISGSATASSPVDAYRAGSAAYFDQMSVRKAVALVDLVEGLQRVSDAYYRGARAVAELEARRTLGQISAEASAVGDGTLDGEVKLARELLATVEASARP